MMALHLKNNSGRKKPPIRMSGRGLSDARSSTLLVGTWNVRTLNEIGKLEHLKKEMKRMSLDVIGISEVRWPEDCDFWTGEYTMISTRGKKGGRV
ncbi:hypothetical protein PGB90_009202 [Kerria lacca]